MPEKYNGTFQEGPASEAIVSLSQILLAPLDSIFKAQVHAARSFLSFILQMGFPDDNSGEGNTRTDSEETMYYQKFSIEKTNEAGEKATIQLKVPSLALVPIVPLSIEEADFNFQFQVSHIYRHQQMQLKKTEEENLSDDGKKGPDKRPWYLVEDPISIRGVVAPSVSNEVISDPSNESSISINIKLSRQPIPAGLDKLLTSLTQSSEIQSK